MKQYTKYIPDSFLNISQYVSRCDYIFTQPFNEIPYENNKLSDITDNSTIYCWSSFLNTLFEYISKTDIKNITLISGCNDHFVNPNGTIIGWPAEPVYGILPSPKNIIKWHAQNAEVCSDFMKPIPIGTNVFPQTADGMRSKMIDCKRNKLLYTNLNPQTNPIQRNFIKQLILKQCPNVVCNPLVENKEYCEQLQQHLFSLCVPGNGKDTHRVWESIFFGCIPIVEKSNMNDYFATLFPMLVVDRWSDITQEFLMSKYQEITQKCWRYDLLDVDNYFDYHKIPKSNKHKNYLKIIENLVDNSVSRNVNKCYLTI